MRRILFITVMIVSFIPFVVQAAGPIMHVALGERWLALYAPQYTEDEKKLFLLGTVFPDIRYLGVIKRSQSHFKGVTLAKVYESNSPFQRGMLFHSFVDEYREKFVRNSTVEKQFVEVPRHLQGTFLKLVEDQIVHDRQDWAKFRMFLSSIPEEEKIYGIDIQSLTQWHTGLTVYFTTLPSFILTQVSLFDRGILTLDAPTVKLWSTLLPRYATDPKMQKYVDELFLSFEKTLTRKSA
ncbi:MAG: hypothetical protein J0H47_14900 [Gammaproteobacteria bacterium]|nr:hypothetical protein [Gammaproteobacteria bacterium]